MKDCLVLSSGKNKSSVFNGLQAKLTGSNPVALTTFPHLDCGNKYNDLANNSLKTLSKFRYPFLKRTYSVLNLYLKIRSKLPQKSIKVSSKCLVDFSEGDRLCLRV